MKSVLMLLMPLFLFGCMSDSQFKEKLSKTLKENPDVLVGAIKENPDKVIEALNEAVSKAQMVAMEKRKKEEEEKLEASYDNPLQPKIRSDENIRGNKNAPIVLIEYSDFQCPYCGRGYNTVMELMKKYGDKIQFIYKHLPLDFHPQAMPAARYYEAIRLQNPDKAWKFHDEIFKNMSQLSKGEGFLKKLAKDLGVNMSKLEKDVNSKEVQARIDEDIQEAHKFDFQGTPGFIINGVPVKGAYPTSHFETIITELEKRGKIKL